LSAEVIAAVLLIAVPIAFNVAFFERVHRLVAVAHYAGRVLPDLSEER